VAVAATAGAAQVTVHRQARVAILTTGDELIDIDQRPSGAKIRNSNQYLLQALVRSAHGEATLLQAAGDDRRELAARIGEGLDYDVLCITGGVSVGAFDYVPDVLRGHGATFHVHKMAIKPGRPTIFATTGTGRLIFALPGNPVSAFVGFELLVRPALARLEGRSDVAPRSIRARLEGSIPATESRRSYFPARAAIDDAGGWRAVALSWQGSGDSLGLAGANAMIERPPQSPPVRDGDEVAVYLLDRNG
jgi:molybdopterin molybdotransferase